MARVQQRQDTEAKPSDALLHYSQHFCDLCKQFFHPPLIFFRSSYSAISAVLNFKLDLILFKKKKSFALKMHLMGILRPKEDAKERNHTVLFWSENLLTFCFSPDQQLRSANPKPQPTPTPTPSLCFMLPIPIALPAAEANTYFSWNLESAVFC